MNEFFPAWNPDANSVLAWWIKAKCTIRILHIVLLNTADRWTQKQWIKKKKNPNITQQVSGCLIPFYSFKGTLPISTHPGFPKCFVFKRQQKREVTFRTITWFQHFKFLKYWLEYTYSLAPFCLLCCMTNLHTWYILDYKVVFASS